MLWKSQRWTLLFSWQMIPMISMCKSSLQQLLKLLLLWSSQTKVQKYFLKTQCFPVPGFGESSNEDTECVTGQLLLVSLFGGERAWYEMQTREEPWPVGKSWQRLWLDRGLRHRAVLSHDPDSKMQRLGPRGLLSALIPKEFLWERMSMWFCLSWASPERPQFLLDKVQIIVPWSRWNSQYLRVQQQKVPALNNNMIK